MVGYNFANVGFAGPKTMNFPSIPIEPCSISNIKHLRPSALGLATLNKRNH